jgi:hypothetical protein
MESGHVLQVPALFSNRFVLGTEDCVHGLDGSSSIEECCKHLVDKDVSHCFGVGTNTDANLLQREALFVMLKLVGLVGCDTHHFKILQVPRYQTEQEFRPHMEGYPAPAMPAMAICTYVGKMGDRIL